MENTQLELENVSSETNTLTLFSIECNINNLGRYKLNVHFEELCKYFAAIVKDENGSQNFDANIIVKLLAEQISIFGNIANAMFKDVTILNEMKSFSHQTPVSKYGTLIPNQADVPIEINRAQNLEVQNILNPYTVKVECDVRKMPCVSSYALEKVVPFFPKLLQKEHKTLKFQDFVDLKNAEQKLKNNDVQHILNYNTMYEYFKGKEHITISNTPLKEFRDVTKKYCGLSSKICSLDPLAAGNDWNELLTEENEVLEELCNKAHSSFQNAERTLSQVKKNLEHTSGRIKDFLFEVEGRRCSREEWYKNFMAQYFPNGIPKPKSKE